MDTIEPDATKPWWRFPLIDAAGVEVGHVDTCGQDYEVARAAAEHYRARVGAAAFCLGKGKRTTPDGDTLN